MKLSNAMSVGGLLIGFAALSACQSGGGVHAVGVPSQSAQTSTFDQVKGLEGEWVIVKTNGVAKKDGGSVIYHQGSGGSSIREIMFPGTPHEMTNMYHM